MGKEAIWSLETKDQGFTMTWTIMQAKDRSERVKELTRNTI